MQDSWPNTAQCARNEAPKVAKRYSRPELLPLWARPINRALHFRLLGKQKGRPHLFQAQLTDKWYKDLNNSKICEQHDEHFESHYFLIPERFRDGGRSEPSTQWPYGALHGGHQLLTSNKSKTDEKYLARILCGQMRPPPVRAERLLGDRVPEQNELRPQSHGPLLPCSPRPRAPIYPTSAPRRLGAYRLDTHTLQICSSNKLPIPHAMPMGVVEPSACSISDRVLLCGIRSVH